jgi:nitric oxide reductase NorD protein
LSTLDYLSWVAGAIAGRNMPVATSKSVGPVACSDGHRIFLPNGYEDEAALWATVVSQTCLIAAGSLEPPLMQHLLGRNRAALRFAYVEVQRACVLYRDRLPMWYSNLSEFSQSAPLSESAKMSLQIALGSTPLPETPSFFGTIKPLMVLRRALREGGLAALAATRPLRTGAPYAEPEMKENLEDQESSKILKLFQNPLARHNALSNFLNSLFGSGLSRNSENPGESGGGGADMPISQGDRPARPSIHMQLARSRVDGPEIEMDISVPPLSYPEWDDHHDAYRDNWVYVEEVDPWHPDGPQDLDDAIKAPPREWKRQLSSLGLDHELHRRQQDGADLDLGALLDCAIDLRTTGSSPTLNIYRASRRTRRDLAVAIVLDISGSTAERDARGTSVFRKQLQLIFQLGHTLDSLGDQVAMFGFHSWGRKRVRVVRIKNHDERWNSKIVHRLALLQPVGYTRLGTAIRHGNRLLRNGVRLPNRLMVLVTDGFAYDQDYENSYAEADARKALDEAKAGGTACVCLSVGSSANAEMLTSLFGTTNCLAADEVVQITPRIGALCRQTLISVSKRRLARS